MEDSKIIDLNNIKKREKEDKPVDDESFESIMEKNRKLKERKAQERSAANKDVLRSYRIKQ